ncbi:hypothetical protein Q667_17545 [Marinobacter sp. C1S70]|jgi:hypothetical protein|nr:hypothetical protein Q667_17545 [Marinobacter sp. C1S70]
MNPNRSVDMAPTIENIFFNNLSDKMTAQVDQRGFHQQHLRVASALILVTEGVKFLGVNFPVLGLLSELRVPSPSLGQWDYFCRDPGQYLYVSLVKKNG